MIKQSKQMASSWAYSCIDLLIDRFCSKGVDGWGTCLVLVSVDFRMPT